LSYPQQKDEVISAKVLILKRISSKSNSYIKDIRHLIKKKFRDETGKYYLEGIKLIGEALKAHAELESVIFCPDFLSSDFGMHFIEIAGDSGVEVLEVSQDVFKSISLKERPQGIAAIGRQKWIDIQDLDSPQGLWIILINIQDPGNLGTILRSLNGACGMGAIIVGDATDAYHPTAVRSSTGALYNLKLCKISKTELIKWKSSINIPFIGTICEEGINLKKFQFPENMCLVMGSEQKGLNKEIIDICDDLVTIPMGGSIDSLNLACAASIVLFEIYHQRIAL
jgi:RNA methyltransferase, TrmH family